MKKNTQTPLDLDRVHWQWLTLDEMNGKDFYRIAKLRQEIFIIEQACIFSDLDELDVNTHHLLGMQGEELVGYLRVLPPPSSRDPVYFSRVATPLALRRSGIGRQLIQKAIDYIHSQFPKHEIVISAQTYLEKFYNDFGFTRIGTPYKEDNIPHIAMRRPNEL